MKNTLLFFIITCFTLLGVKAQNSLKLDVFNQTQLIFKDGSSVQAKSWLMKDKENKVVFFWATWCGPCVMEMEALKEGVENNSADPTNVYFVTDESESKVNAYIKKKSMQEMNIVFMNTRIPELGIMGIPYSVAFNGQGEIVATETGYRNKRHTLDFIEKYGK